MENVGGVTCVEYEPPICHPSSFPKDYYSERTHIIVSETGRDPSRPSKFQFKLYSVCNFLGVTYIPILSLRLREDYCILYNFKIYPTSDLGVTL